MSLPAAAKFLICCGTDGRKFLVAKSALFNIITPVGALRIFLPAKTRYNFN